MRRHLPRSWKRFLSTARIPVKKALGGEATTGDVIVCGWVTSVRKQKNITFVNISDGSTLSTLQLIAPTTSIPHAQDLTIGCSVTAQGQLAKSTHSGQCVELQVTSLQLLGACDPTDYPFHQRAQHTSSYVRRFPHLRAHIPSFASLLRIRHSATLAIHNFFQRSGFINVHTPILSSSDCEATGEQFEVKTEFETSSNRFFGHKTFLTVSGQLHAETLSSGMTSVYTFGPTFRAEKSHTYRHLAEFYMVEAETVCTGTAGEGLHALMEVIECLIQSTLEDVLEGNAEDMELFNKKAKDSNFPPLDLKKPIERMTYSEAIQVLQSSEENFNYEPKWGCDLRSEHEQYLLAHCGQLPLFVTDFPAAVRPFYAKMNKGEDPLQTVSCLDLLVPGVGELVGGSMREDDYHIMKQRLDSEGKTEQYQWYLDLRRFGSVPHGGFGLGFERLLQAMLGVENIRDVIAFPRYAGSCLL